MAYNFFVHNDLTFGKDAVQELPNILAGEGVKNVMIIYDEGVKVAGIAEKVVAQVEKADVEITIFDKVLPNPSNELVEEAAAIAQEKKIDGFVAVGGGSSIDLAKAVNVLMTNPGPIGQYGGIGLVKNKVHPLIAIPTTAGTSSEITNVTALTDTVAVCKYVVIDNKLVPSHVIADPEFTRTMPKSVTAATGMDAITHAVESYISNMATPLTEYNSITECTFPPCTWYGKRNRTSVCYRIQCTELPGENGRSCKSNQSSADRQHRRRSVCTCKRAGSTDKRTWHQTSVRAGYQERRFRHAC